MEITFKKVIEEKVNITLPAYYKTGAHQMKIFSTEKCLCVCYDGDIGVKHAELPFNVGATESSESEFLDLYNKVQSDLQLIATA
jgi:hypothetical protein